MSVVHIILGSASDRNVADRCTAVLQRLNIPFRLDICSFHRDPERLIRLVSRSEAKVFIAVAGLAAALPGAVAAHTTRPVIGVPVSGRLNLDSILSILQMPSGVPVGCVGLDAGENAAVLAAEILALTDQEISSALQRFREERRVPEGASAAGDRAPPVP